VAVGRTLGAEDGSEGLLWTEEVRSTLAPTLTEGLEISARADPPERRPVDRHRPLLPFFALTFAWTWSLWWTVAAFPRLPGPWPFLLFLTGGLGPLVGAAWVVRHGGRAYRGAFLRRLWDPHRIPLRWWLALVAVAAGPAVLGAIVAEVAGAAVTVPDLGLGHVGGVVAFALAAGLVEEPGWRGAASDAWQVRTRPVWAALGIGGCWVLWHLPLYFVEGSYQHGLGFGSLRFWLTNLVLLQLAVLYTWLANGAGGSILVAILAHAGTNALGELVPRSTLGDVLAFVVVAAATAAVIATTRGRLRFEVAAPAISDTMLYPDTGRSTGTV
jgi:uncharacterized protein